MKKLAVLLWMSLFPFLLLAQISTVQSQENQQQKPLTIHELLYQSRTATITSDLTTPQIQDNDHEYLFNPDTTWSYIEAKWQGFEDYVPSSFNQIYDVGSEFDFARDNLTYNWEGDSSRWVLGHISSNWIKDAFLDSSKSYDVDNDGKPTYGSFLIYSRTPAMGATSESIYHRYERFEGWIMDTKFLNYENEDETIRWNKTFRYNPDSADFYISNENLTEDLETHYLYEYISYAGGKISYYTKDFELYNPDGTPAYSVDYSYNGNLEEFYPTDSTAFIYHENFAEAFSYRWYTDFDEWELDRYSSTYESPSTNSHTGFKVDSIITREVVYDVVLDSMVLGMVTNKTVYIYDVNDNLIENIVYQIGSNGLAPFSRYTYEYELIDGEYHQTYSQSYMYSYLTMDLYLWGENRRYIEDGGNSFGDMTLFFSEEGDTTNGFKSMMFLEGDNFYSFNYNWDHILGDFILSGFMVEAFSEPVSFFGYVSSEWGSDRSIHVMNSMPAAVNPGPLFLALNDTVDFVIPAFNPDMSSPTLSMSGIPATATFDPDTNRFYWIVDEVVDGPFQITATQGAKSTTIDVKVVYGEFSVVGTETENDVPAEITLYQNYPNPFNPTTTIGFELSKPQYVTLQVFNILGQPVQTLLNNELITAGLKELPFNAQSLSSGIYYYRLETADKVLTKKMTLVK